MSTLIDIIIFLGREHKLFLKNFKPDIVGLTVTVNIGQDNYIQKIGGAAGARLVIHPQNSMPHPEETGYLAQPGQLLSVGVKKVQSNFL